MNAIILGVFWLIYYAMVSALAADRIRYFFARQLPAVATAYRILLPLFSGVNFAFLLWFHILTPSKPIFQSILTLRLSGYFLAGAAMAVVLFSVRRHHLRFWENSEADEDLEWMPHGMHRYVRFPFYFSAILILIAILLVFPVWKNAIFMIVTIVYICIGALIRDRKRLDIYGRDYLDYKSQIKMLIPFVV